MLNRFYIFLSLLFCLNGLSQSGNLAKFKAELSTYTSDSVFIAIDEHYQYLDSINASHEAIIELMELKIEMADSLEFPTMKYYAYQTLSNYPDQYTIVDYIKLLKQLGNAQSKIGSTDQAMKTYFEAAHLADSLQNDTLIADIYRTIGTKYKNQRNAELALKYLNKALVLNKKMRDSVGILNCYMTMGNAYKMQRDIGPEYLDTAQQYYEKSLAISLSLNNTRGLAGNYNNIGNIYRIREDFEQALEYYFMALEINQMTGNRSWLSYNYNNIGTAYNESKNPSAAITYLKKSLALKEELGDLESLPPTLENLGSAEASLGNFESAYRYAKRMNELKTSIANTERERLAQELEAKFQNEKSKAEISALKAEQSLQELIIEGQKKDLELQEALRSQEKNLIYALGVILLSLIASTFVFWRNNRQKRKYNQELKTKNSKIKQINLEIDHARLNLEHKNQEITDSINYAKRIQAAILPSQKILASHLNEAFVLYLPKDIVAGDFYWTERIGDTILFAVADCTGHGVPGAMVSVICHSALNTAIKQNGLTDPGEILDLTTDLVMEQFERSEEEVKDGMDIALCSFNVKTRSLKYAGANTPLWIVRGDEIIKFKANRQPVGRYQNRTAFNSQDVEIQKGDIIYLSSDGYTDQFGGEKGKKFLKKRFRELLIRTAKKPIQTQSNLLLQAFEEWKQHYDQVDDVCVMGVKVDA